jgi:hypothetical protein
MYLGQCFRALCRMIHYCFEHEIFCYEEDILLVNALLFLDDASPAGA